jgi:aryl-alcohol dehydrogenase-like predicted oxidoreductase
MNYTNGTSEKFLGEFIVSEREAVVLATKYTNGFGDGNTNGSGNQRKNMVQSVEASLKRLNTDYIDILWLHVWDFMTPAEEVMRAFDDLVRAGKVFYIGISDAPALAIAKSKALYVLAPKERRVFLTFDQKFSIGLKSGEYPSSVTLRVQEAINKMVYPER